MCTHQGNVCVAIAQALEAAKPLWGQHLALLFPYNQGVICNPSLSAGLWHHVLAQIFAIGGVKKYQIKRRAGAGRQLQQIPWPKGDLDVWIKQSFIFADQFCRFTSVIDQPQTLCAPRERASNPKAPVPAKRSRTCAFSKGFPNRPEASTLNKFSRTRSVVGRKCAEGSPLPTEAKALPRCVPAIILKISAGI